MPVNFNGTNAPPPPTGMRFRGFETPVTDLKRRTMIRYPYTDQAKEGLWRTPVRFNATPDRPSRFTLGTYNNTRAQDNYLRRLMGTRGKEEVEVWMGGSPAADEETMAHEYAHKYYYTEPEVAWNWTWNAPEDKKQEAWESYGTDSYRQQLSEEPKSIMAFTNPREAESFATAAEKTYKTWRPEEFEEQFSGLYMPEDREQDQLSPVVTKARGIPEQARIDWGGPNDRRGEY